jgi:hypothetical protein
MCALTRVSLAALLTAAASAQPSSAPPAFEDADVHVSAPSNNQFVRGPFLGRGRYEIRSATMVDLIAPIANELTPKRVQPAIWSHLQDG